METLKQKHYGHRFILKMDKLPAKAINRSSRLKVMLALLLGILLIVFGAFVYQANSALDYTALKSALPPEHVPLHNFLPPSLFPIIIIIIGLSLSIYALIKCTFYKVIFFDGQDITLKHYQFGTLRQSFTEPLYNYEGVLLRVEFYQSGLINKNKFIIELYHNDPEKIVPLYISTSSRSIRRRWKEYAQMLKMPALKISDKGLVSYNALNLDLPYKENIEQWHLNPDFVSIKQKPAYIQLRYKNTGEKMIKINKVFLDAFNILTLGLMLVLTALFYVLWQNKEDVLAFIPLTWFVLLTALTGVFFIFVLLEMLTKDILIIAKRKIVLFRKNPLYRTFEGIIHLNDIKGVDINFTPTLNRYNLVILSNQETLVVGQKLPVSDLRWIRSVLIKEIIGN